MRKEILIYCVKKTFIFIALAAVFYSFFHFLNDYLKINKDLSELIAAGVNLSLILWIFKKDYDKNIFKIDNLNKFLPFFLLFLCADIAYSYFIGPRIGYKTIQDLNPEFNNGIIASIYVFLLVFGEELVFRGILLPHLRKGVNLYVSVLLATLFFCGGHLFINFTYLFFLGLIYSTAFILTGTIWTPVFIHLVHNLFAKGILKLG